jgi:hypothetical protein
MTTPAKRSANKANAKKSTGPKSSAGKALARLNPVSHGLRSPAPVIPGEDPAEWAAFQDGVVNSFAPADPFQAELAARVASLMWRLRRVIRFETGITTAATGKAVGKVLGGGDPADPLAALMYRDGGMTTRTSVAGRRKERDDAQTRLAEAEADLGMLDRLPGLADGDPIPGDQADGVLSRIANGREAEDAIDYAFLAAVGVPAGWHDAAGEWDGWTAGALRAGLTRLAQWLGTTADALTAETREDLVREAAGFRRELPRLEAALAQAEADSAGAVAAATARASLPYKDAVDKLTRYEGHLHRQLVQTLHLLERVQAARAGRPVPVPVAVDVTVESPIPLPGS